MAKKKKNKNQKHIGVNANRFKAMSQIVPKAMPRLRSDIDVWKKAETMATHPENPKKYMLHHLFKEIEKDALLSSQINNRKLKVLGSEFSIKNGDKTDDETTALLSQSKWFSDIIGFILDSIYFGYTLIELNIVNDKPTVTLIPRTNVVPEKGIILKDYNEDKGIDYINAKEYGTWLLSFGKVQDLGLLNKAIPHVLFKKFAYSCWSELSEIYGIPPRVMKTNTQDPAALAQADRMMRNWGAAAWVIIDETESIDFAKAVNTKGEVYQELMNFANNELSLLLSGAVVGQDTKNGSNAKEQSSQDLLLTLIQADKTMVERYLNDKVLPALANIGLIPADLKFQFDQVENIAELWNRTKEILPYKNVDDQWITDKFGIKVTGDRTQQGNNQSLGLDFFD